MMRFQDMTHVREATSERQDKKSHAPNLSKVATYPHRMQDILVYRQKLYAVRLRQVRLS